MRKLFFGLLFLASFIFTNQVNAETSASGNITSNTTWTLANSPYTITATVQILYGTTLTIEPGVIVNGNSTSIQVGGKLNAIGTSNSKIVFNNIKMAGIGTTAEPFEINVQFSEINSGSFYYWPDTMYGSLILRDSKIKSSSFIFLWYPTVDSYIERNVFTDTGGISVGTSNNIKVYIRNNVFYNTTNWQGDSAIEVWNDYPTSETIVEYNSFLSTNKIALRLPVGYSNANMTANNNFWNTTDESVINSMIFDRNDDLRSANYIVYSPILTEPHPNTPIFTVTPVISTCASWTYSDWSSCSNNSQQTRSIVSSSPVGCAGGYPILNQNCVFSTPAFLPNPTPNAIPLPPTITSITSPDGKNIVSPTTEQRILISGTKEPETNILIFGTCANYCGEPYYNSWSYNASLLVGENKFTFTVKNKYGDISSPVTVTIVFNGVPELTGAEKEIALTENIKKLQEQIQQNKNNIETANQKFSLPDGAIIKGKGDIDVYIIKYVGVKKFKRLVLSPSVFNNYGHLKWENIIEVDQSTLNYFTTSDIVRATNDDKVYKLHPSGDTGQKQWIKTSEAFIRMGFDWDSIYEINQFDRDSYLTGSLIE